MTTAGDTTIIGSDDYPPYENTLKPGNVPSDAKRKKQAGGSTVEGTKFSINKQGMVWLAVALSRLIAQIGVVCG